MHTSFWSVKGGVGVSTCAALHAIALAGRAERTLLVDLTGDQAPLLGVDDPPGPGLFDWIADGARDPSALDRIATEITADLTLLHRGSLDRLVAGGIPDDLDVSGLVARAPHVVVDCGLASNRVERAFLQSATRRFLVLRRCYLALRSARDVPVEPTGVVAVSERGRSLQRSDIEAVTGSRVVADLAVDLSIARAIDAGLLASRLPRGVRRVMEGLAHVPTS